jgi:hypothetical protein
MRFVGRSDSLERDRGRPPVVLKKAMMSDGSGRSRR